MKGGGGGEGGLVCCLLSDVSCLGEGVPRVFQPRAQSSNGRDVFTAALTVDVFHTSENKFPALSHNRALLNDNVSLEMITYR